MPMSLRFTEEVSSATVQIVCGSRPILEQRVFIAPFVADEMQARETHSCGHQQAQPFPGRKLRSVQTALSNHNQTGTDAATVRSEQPREAGFLLRDRVETLAEFLKKSESESALHRALRSDLEHAEEVHKAFFPQENFSIRGLTYETFYRPANCIGGDYYDFLPLHADRWGFAVGDVCGKGIGAALLMASLQASLRAQTMHDHSDLSTLVSHVDRLFLAASPKHLYASLFYAEYDAVTRVLNYVNAGHNAPIVVRWKHGQCNVFHLEASGTPLGLLEGSQFTSKAFQFEKGDVLVMYTDGITETENPNGELWGRERVESLLRACRDCTPAQIVGRVVKEVLTFAEGCAQRDDMTLVVVGVKDEREFDGTYPSQ